MDLTEAEDIQKRWQEYTEELYKKDLHNLDNPDGVIIHLEPDILECEVKWSLESITTNKASGGDAIPVELFQILIDDAVKVLQCHCLPFKNPGLFVLHPLVLSSQKWWLFLLLVFLEFTFPFLQVPLPIWVQ